MKKFSKLLLFVMEIKDSLSKQLLEEAEKLEDIDTNPNVIAVNTAHKEVEKILQYGYALLKEDIPDIERISKCKHLKLLKEDIPDIETASKRKHLKLVIGG